MLWNHDGVAVFQRCFQKAFPVDDEIFTVALLIIHPSIHPSSAASPEVGSRGQQLEQRSLSLLIRYELFIRKVFILMHQC